ncbi:MAG: radical SAM protein [Muribaculaceae bacterium]|nr:radical SAM protein [Muribaculaceae bacterium]
MPTIIFKATEACNANCVYCDVVHRKKPRTISPELLRTAFERFNEYLLEHPEEEMQIIWHGGEPCMAGLKLYQTALEYLNTICAATRDRFKFAVQSNLTMINQDFIDTFKAMGIDSIGTSYEPIHGVRGIGKKRDSVLYNKKFFDGINLLEANNMGWGFIYVVTRQVLDRPLEIFHHLTNLKLSGGFDLHPVLVYDDAADESMESGITQEEFADWLGAVFKEWWPNRERYPHVDPFATYLKFYTGKGDGLGCCDAPTCGLHLYLGPDGETAQCGRAADWDILMYGNIASKPLSEIFADEQRALIDNRKNVLPDTDCKGCEYWSICHGGCPLDAYNGHKDFNRRSDQCLSKKLFLKKYFEPITGLKLPKPQAQSHE